MSVCLNLQLCLSRLTYFLNLVAKIYETELASDGKLLNRKQTEAIQNSPSIAEKVPSVYFATAPLSSSVRRREYFLYAWYGVRLMSPIVQQTVSLFISSNLPVNHAKQYSSSFSEICFVFQAFNQL